MSVTVTQTIQEVELRPRRRVTWAPNTIDNEHLNRKKSKVCCIHHSKANKGCKSKNKYERM